MKKIMFWGDSPTLGTGFGNVIKSIVNHLPKDRFKISVLGVHYKGEPHALNCYIYPVKGSAEHNDKDELAKIIKKENPDIIFLLHDIWVIDPILNFFKEFNIVKKRKVVAYIPVDATDHDSRWYHNTDILSQLVVYNKFGKDVVNKARPDINPIVIEHGVDSEIFYKTKHSKKELRKMLFGDAVELDEGFIFLNAGRNQPRKALDITMRAFAEFAKDKSDVYLYMHCGYLDSHIDILRLADILGIHNKILMTTKTPGLPNVPTEHLNLIYNFCDVGLNSGLGEGFGLPNAEHSAAGKPQIVPDHSALTELYSDCGLLIPAKIKLSMMQITTTGKMIDPVDMVVEMNKLYHNRLRYDKLSKAAHEKFTSNRYSWKHITKEWVNLFNKLL